MIERKNKEEILKPQLNKGRNKYSSRDMGESIVRTAFLLSALMSIVGVLLISIFIFFGGFAAIGEIGFTNFIFGQVWRPSNGLYGIFPMIVGSVYVTLRAAIIGGPIGVMTAVYLAEYCPRKVKGAFTNLINLMAGIPSVLYGFFGLVVIVPFIRENFPSQGMSLLAAAVLLGIMILPTIVSISRASIEAVDRGYYEGSLALGATKERSIFAVKMRAAGSGIISSINFRGR
ncbi:PstC family ABC transporter permease [Eubacteriales bacterium KG127]